MKEEFDITFSCSDWAIRKYSPVIPASEYYPKELLELPTGEIIPFDQKKELSTLTARQCPAISNYMHSGYILRAWCDIEISFQGEEIRLQMSNNDYGYEIHSREQFKNLIGSHFNVRTSFKFNNPRTIETKKGYGCLWLPYFYHNKNYQALPAVVDTDIMLNRNPINIMLFRKESTLIKMGDPLVHLIPFKKTNITGLSKEYTEKDHKKFLDYLNLIKLTRFGWRNFIKDKISYSLVKKDTDHSL